MKNILVIIILACSFSFNSVWAVEQLVTLQVENMTCALCAVTVRKALEAVDGVEYVDVSYPDKTVRVSYDDKKTDVSILTKATTLAGYPSVQLRTEQNR